MAKNKVEIDVVVDDSGTMGKVGLGAKKAGEGLGKAGTEADNFNKKAKGVGQAGLSAGKGFSKMAQGAGSFVGAYATLAANLFAITAAFGFLKRASDLSNMEKGQLQFAQSTGKALGSVTRRLREASGGMLGFQKAAEAAAIGTAKGFSSAQLEELAEGARKASTALGRSYEDTFDRLVRGASKAEPELLDELGITLRLEDAAKRYGAAIGKNADKLTVAEKSQAVLLETTRQLNENFGDVEAAVNPFVLLQNTMTDIAREVTEAVLPAFTALATFLSENAGAAAAALAAVGLYLLNSMTGVVGKLGTVLGFGGKSFVSFGAKASKGFRIARVSALKSSKAIIKALEEQEKKIKDTKTVAGEQASGIMKTGAPSKILTKVAAGQDLGIGDQKKLDKALERAKSNLDEFGKVKTGIFKGSDKAVLDSFKSTMGKVGKESLTTGQKFKKFFAKTSIKAVKGLQKVIKGTTRGLKFMGRAAKTAGKAIKFMSKATGILALIGGIVLMFDKIMQKPMDFVTSIAKMLKTVLRGLQGFLNLVATGINSLANKLPDWAKKALGIEGGKKLISPFTFADDFDVTALEDKMLAMLGTDREAAIAKGAQTDQLQLQASLLEDMKSSYAEMGTEAKSIFKGIVDEKDTGKKSAMVANAVGTLGIGSEMSKIGKLKDPQAQADARAALIASLEKQGAGETGLGDVLPGLLEALKEGSAEDIAKYETAAGVVTRNIAGIKSTTDSLATLITPDNLLGAENTIRGLIESAANADKAATVLEQVGDQVQTVEDIFAKAGGSGAYLKSLETNRQELDRLAKEKVTLDEGMISATRLPAAMEAQRKLELSAAIALNAELTKKAEKQTIINQLALNSVGPEQRIELEAKLELLKEEIRLMELKTGVAKKNADEIDQIGQTLGNSLESNMTSAFTALVEGTKSAKAAFADMAKSIIADIARMIVKMMVMKMIKSMFGGADGGFLGLGKFMDLGDRYGGVRNPDGRKQQGYATGGVAKGSTSGYPAVLHGTEAVVPLPNGKSIPVDMKDSGATNNNIVVNVSADGASQKKEGSTGPDMDKLGGAIAQAVQAELQNQKRSGGILNPYGAA
jgi:hypothetical protein